MLNNQTAAVPDIYVDKRIPYDAYRPTFVRSLIIGAGAGGRDRSAPIGASLARDAAASRRRYQGGEANDGDVRRQRTAALRAA